MSSEQQHQTQVSQLKMKLLILTCLIAAALTEDSLRQVLQSPTALLNFYKSFKDNQHLHFDGVEDRFRFRLFRDNAAQVADFNDEVGETATYGVNFFSSMTSEEKQLYLGLNVTGKEMNPPDTRLRSSPTGPSSVLWTNQAAVTAVKNQGSCGSCWSFGAVGGLETRYQQKAGVLKSFAEQEYLDCVYEGSRDGCRGGWMKDCYVYSANNGGRLATTRNYAYTARDGTCVGKSKKDGMIAFKIRGNVPLATSEAAHIEALQQGSVTVAFEVTSKCQQYRGGIFKDTTCTGYANHAVTAVGYTSSYILVKNSWGGSWGDKGFIKFARNYHNCKMYQYSSYPKLEATGEKDSDPADKATDYKADDSSPDPEPKPDPSCENNWRDSSCETYKKYGYCDRYTSVQENCKKSCGLCDDECAPGTIRCPDGVCRHEHMC